MLIRCTLERPGGTVTTMPNQGGDTTIYHFKSRREGGPHVADVDNPAHAARFLEISEAYQLAEEQPPPPNKRKVKE